MHLFTTAPIFIGLATALPQAAPCTTITSEIIVPTKTYTFLSTYVTTTHATTARDLGTFTDVTTIRSIRTLGTLTSTATFCTASGTITQNPTVTVYISLGSRPSTAAKVTSTTQDCRKRHNPALHQRQTAGCTVTRLVTTTNGVTETYLPANVTSTYTQYTAYTQRTVSSTTYGGTTYTIATTTVTSSVVCGPTVNATTPSTSWTVTQDVKCAPSALVSAAGAGSSGRVGYGLLYIEDVPGGGSSYVTSTNDASQCCQLCVEEEGCAASAWDIRSKACHLEFSVGFSNGQLNCGEGAIAFYNYGPDHPMAPGTGWYIGTGCGDVQYAAAKPDDGT